MIGIINNKMVNVCIWIPYSQIIYIYMPISFTCWLKDMIITHMWDHLIFYQILNVRILFITTINMWSVMESERNSPFT